MNITLTIGLVLASLLGVALHPATQIASSITGVVRDSDSGELVWKAEVSIAGTNLGALTNDQGEFRIDNVPAGTHQLEVRRIGYVRTLIQRAVREGVTDTVAINIMPTRGEEWVWCAEGSGPRDFKDGEPLEFDGIRVVLRDAKTHLPLRETAIVTARNAKGTDTLRVASASVPYPLYRGVRRYGTYTILVEAPGYVMRSAVQVVTSAGCDTARPKWTDVFLERRD